MPPTTNTHKHTVTHTASQTPNQDQPLLSTLSQLSLGVRRTNFVAHSLRSKLPPQPHHILTHSRSCHPHMHLRLKHSHTTAAIIPKHPSTISLKNQTLSRRSLGVRRTYFGAHSLIRSQNTKSVFYTSIQTHSAPNSIPDSQLAHSPSLHPHNHTHSHSTPIQTSSTSTAPQRAYTRPSQPFLKCHSAKKTQPPINHHSNLFRQTPIISLTHSTTPYSNVILSKLPLRHAHTILHIQPNNHHQSQQPN